MLFRPDPAHRFLVSVCVNRNKISRRYESGLLRYNRLSADLALDAGFEVNDMFEKLSSTNFNALLLPDSVHFTPSGNELIGKFIAESVQSVRPRLQSNRVESCSPSRQCQVWGDSSPSRPIR